MGTFSMGRMIRTSEDEYAHIVNVPKEIIFYKVA